MSVCLKTITKDYTMTLKCKKKMTVQDSVGLKDVSSSPYFHIFCYELFLFYSLPRDQEFWPSRHVTHIPISMKHKRETLHPCCEDFQQITFLGV